ncbi:LysR family transcriptional regulator [Streptomyces iconiensis]|uniref:LysR family transcriptional regulator n=1 Tax=Streptomyces iconiensis TaxID=1384038 RepID=A0ABT6ZQG6_9ACTN|nr:LysR family transcriptional regulator [Streptomyces iconiensis]MDJ1131049.1 LysR family transcriptional regulator [Streptomyces iconiensis]
MIDSRLQTLRVLHQYGTVTATAEALHLTPSTVSQQLRQLAAHVDLELLEPVGRRVRLTPAALALLRHADALHARWEEATADLAAHREGAAGRLRITAIATALAALAVPAAARLRDQWPGLDVELSENPVEDRYGLVLTGEADIAVVLPTPDSPPADDPRFTRRSLLEEPQDLLVPRTHPFAARTGVPLAEAAHETWIRSGDPRDQYQLLLSACAAAGFTPRVCHAAVDWTAVAALVAHGFGLSLVPRLAPVPSSLPLVRVPLQGRPSPVRRVVACVRRGAEEQPAVAHGLTALQETAAAYAGTPGTGTP